MSRTSYRLKKSFQFRSAYQANAFLQIANIYGRGKTFENVVLYEATLDFVIWRKLKKFAWIISQCTSNDINIYEITSQAGFKAFREDSL